MSQIDGIHEGLESGDYEKVIKYLKEMRKQTALEFAGYGNND
jgi:hypothetical protein